MALLELKEISKEYSGKKVLDTVSLKIGNAANLLI